MTNQSKTNTPAKGPSKLDQFDLKFELDVSWTDARGTIRQRGSNK